MRVWGTISWLSLSLFFIISGCTSSTSVVVIDLIDYYCDQGANNGNLLIGTPVHCESEINVGQTNRPALVFSRPSQLDIYLHCPEEAPVLQFWLGIGKGPTDQWPSEHFTGVATLDFSVELSTDRPKSEAEFRYTPALESLAHRWLPITINLYDYQNEIIRLRLRWQADHENPGFELALGSPTIKSGQLLSHEAPDFEAEIATTVLNPPYGHDNLLLILVDTLRADSTGFGGHPQAKTPQLDRLTRQGIIFADTLSSTSWTRPAVATLFTGTMPLIHQARNRKDKLRKGLPTLAENFKARGFKTFGYVGNANVDSTFGFGRGFDVYQFVANVPTKQSHLEAQINKGLDPSHSNNGSEIADSRITALVNSAIQSARKERFFMYIHYCHPHIPYEPSRNYYDTAYNGHIDGKKNSLMYLQSLTGRRLETDLDHLENLYLSEITDIDTEIGRIIEQLRSNELLTRTSIVFVSDHGDEFYEHDGWGHGSTLYQEVVRVPFFMSLPRWSHNSVISMTQAELADIYPTVADMYGFMGKNQYLTGKSLFQAIAQAEASSPEASPANQRLLDLDLDDKRAYACFIDNYKLIVKNRCEPELYEQKEYVDEYRNLAALLPIRTAYYSFLLEKELARNDTLQKAINDVHNPDQIKVEVSDLSDEVRENLKALGYLH
ncbi:sulfatase-like hydrolase/transferase [bacterium]|nr:sulfatase-like hydrolase/transferase [bacterium]